MRRETYELTTVVANLRDLHASDLGPYDGVYLGNLYCTHYEGNLLEDPGELRDAIRMVRAQGRRARLASARERVITVPFWTDSNNFAAQAHPLLYPSIGLGFRFGENPEIFSVADPKAGLMFTNDVMPVKVRYFYATGPMDWRGLHKSNVA